MRSGNGESDDQPTWDSPLAVGSTTLGTQVALPPEVARRRSTQVRSTETSRGFDEAMRGREIAAMRGFVYLVLALSAAVMAAAPLLNLVASQLATLAAGVAIAGGGALLTWRKLRAGRLERGDVWLIGSTAMVGGSLGVFTFGFFSPAPLSTVMGVFFFGLQRYRRVATGTFVGTCVIHLGIMLAQTFGLIADRGVIDADDVSTRHKLVAAGLVQVVFLLTFFLARATQRAIVASALRLEESTRALAQREALLDEARRELERVLEVGGPGRFTEQRLGLWQLGNLCGRGAMGDVYVASHVHSGQRAAVKLLTRDSARDPDSVRRFLREARIAASIDVPNVVRVLEVGSDDAPVPFIAMELLEGRDLASILRKERRLPRCELIEMLRQIGRGLDAAHAAGVVHRDLKPQNLFKVEDADGLPVWKILDFGVSRMVDVDSSLTRGQAIGTPSYMSPEQARGLDVDRRADIFALGVLAYRALTGRPPFAGSEVPQILYRVVYGMPPRPSELIDVPPAVDDVLAIALAKRPEDRFARAGELVEALASALDAESEAMTEVTERARRLTSRLPWGQEEQAPGARHHREHERTDTLRPEA
jgi:serine/threonine-protein kinase